MMSRHPGFTLRQWLFIAPLTFGLGFLAAVML